MSNPNTNRDELLKLCESWGSVDRPNAPVSGFDFESVNELVELIRQNCMQEVADSSALRSINKALVPPNLTSAERDFSWLEVHWHISRIKGEVDRLTEIDSAATSTQEVSVSVAKYFGEVELIRDEIRKISAELHQIRVETKRSGVSLGAFGVSVSLEALASYLKLVRQELRDSSGQIRIRIVVNALSGAFEKSKEIAKQVSKAPVEGMLAASKLFTDITLRTGRALLAALRIKKDASAPPKFYATMAVVTVDDRTLAASVSDLLTIRSDVRILISQYQLRVLDWNLLRQLEQLFRKFMFLIAVNRGSLKLVLAVAKEDYFRPSRLKFEMRTLGKKVAFTMDALEYVKNLSAFIENVAAEFSSDKSGRFNNPPEIRHELSQYGGILTIAGDSDASDSEP